MTLLLAAVVAVAINVVGALLITALLIIPAAAARNYASTPERMAFLSMGIGALSAIARLCLAVIVDTSVGPMIICVAALIFALSAVGRGLRGIGT